jgi:hypothetical protein
MAERRSWYGRWIAFGVAVVLALLGAAFLVWSISQHQDARDDLSDVEAQLVTRRANTSTDAKALQREQETVADVHDQLTALDPGAGQLADLDEQDLDAVRAAVQAGLAGKLAEYNAAVDQRAALDPEHDRALEQLRQQAEAVITALS